MKFAIVQAFQDMLNPPKLESIVAEELQGAAQEVSNAKFVIERHQFLLHMAVCKIQALDEWNKGVRRTEVPKAPVSDPVDSVAPVGVSLPATRGQSFQTYSDHASTNRESKIKAESYVSSTGKDYT